MVPGSGASCCQAKSELVNSSFRQLSVGRPKLVILDILKDFESVK